jgi:hypothetical protein
LPFPGQEVRTIPTSRDASRHVAHLHGAVAFWICGTCSPDGLFRNWTDHLRFE